LLDCACGGDNEGRGKESVRLKEKDEEGSGWSG
jgi:hypothetical protein